MAEVKYRMGITQIYCVTINNWQARLIAINHGDRVSFEGIYAGKTLARSADKDKCITEFRSRLKIALDDALCIAEQEVASIKDAQVQALTIFSD